jgi:glycosyltransferase involved in cell wall biosynthesis
VNIVLVSSQGRCGIHDYAEVLRGGLAELGHRARYIGVEDKRNQDLLRKLRAIRRDDDIVIFEYDAGIFRLGGLVAAMAWLRLVRRKQVYLSVHEIAPNKFPAARQVEWHLSRPVSARVWREVVLIPAATLDVTARFVTLRMGLLLLGLLPHCVLVHSPKAAENVRLALSGADKVRYVPLAVKCLSGERETLRQALGLPQDRFAFIVPGFLFRRKRITDVIAQLPPGVELWIVGTESRHESGYLSEVEAYLEESPHRGQVRLIQDYERMEQYLLAADAVVLYYADSYQSGVASLAVGAGRPCIFSDLPAFSDVRDAGLVVRNADELRRAMEGIQDAAQYERLRKKALERRAALSPRRVAAAYLASAGG